MSGVITQVVELALYDLGKWSRIKAPVVITGVEELADPHLALGFGNSGVPKLAFNEDLWRVYVGDNPQIPAEYLVVMDHGGTEVLIAVADALSLAMLENQFAPSMILSLLQDLTLHALGSGDDSEVDFEIVAVIFEKLKKWSRSK